MSSCILISVSVRGNLVLLYLLCRLIIRLYNNTVLINVVIIQCYIM
jgi:hypothetical protein